MLLNFGGNIGLHGKMDALINGFYDAKTDNHAGKTLCGVGMTRKVLRTTRLCMSW